MTRQLWWIAMTLICIAGCTRKSAPAKQNNATGAIGAYHIRNDQIELSVSPATGRIVYFGLIGGSNLLWINSKPHIGLSPFPGWTNWGGDKLWVWPEKDWPVWNGSEAAPPGDPAVGNFTVSVRQRSIRMTSPVIPRYGLRMMREITLDETEPRVTIINTFEQVIAPEQKLPVTPWTVTQIPAPKCIYARLAAGAKSPGYMDLASNPWTPASVAGRVLTFDRPASPRLKIGLDADLLALPVEGDLLFAMSNSSLVEPSKPQEPFTKAQLFTSPDVSSYRAPDVGPYIEIEFTGQLKRLALGQSVSMTTVWQLYSTKARDAVTILNEGPFAK